MAVSAGDLIYLKLTLVCRPITDYLKRMFGSPKYAEAFQYGSKSPKERGAHKDFHADVIDGRAYNNLKASVGLSRTDVVFAFVQDGVQPFKEDSKYSVHPLAFTPLSCSPDLRCVCACLPPACAFTCASCAWPHTSLAHLPKPPLLAADYLTTYCMSCPYCNRMGCI